MPLPPTNELQDRLIAHVEQLQTLVEDDIAERTHAYRAIQDAVSSLGLALDDAAYDFDPDLGHKPAHDAYSDPAWAPFRVVEDWVLREAGGTSSTRAIAICYLAKLTGADLDFEEAFSSTADGPRHDLVRRMVEAPIPPEPSKAPNFWKIWIRYRNALNHELGRQGRL